jgi:hypothetical protein
VLSHEVTAKQHQIVSLKILLIFDAYSTGVVKCNFDIEVEGDDHGRMIGVLFDVPWPTALTSLSPVAAAARVPGDARCWKR